MSSHGWMYKENVAYIHNWIVFEHKKEWDPDICKNMDGDRDHYIKWNKTGKKDKHCMFSLTCGI
jgi:hypothetical protein